MSPSLLLLLAGQSLANCTAIDGDTLRCVDLHTHKTVRVRLSSIDAPEMPTSRRTCRYTEKCPRGDPYTAKRALQRQTRWGTLSITQLDVDHYGRRIAAVKQGRKDLSCYMIENGYAIYRHDWDRRNGYPVRRNCPYIRRNYHWNGKPATK